MRHNLVCSLAAIGLLLGGVAGCAKKPAEPEKISETSAVTSETATSIPTPTSAAGAQALKSLTADQQAAVRALIRDTLVQNPEILLEAQRAYEAKQAKELNDKVAKSFTALKRDEAQLSFGPANAKVTMIEFFDYKCGFCHAANDWVFDIMAKRKDVRVIFKELPILSENSTVAAKAAMAAHKQGKYKELHRALMQARGDLNPDQIFQIAQSVGLNVEKLREDMQSPQIAASINAMRQQATDLGIGGTPGFVINGQLVSGFDKNALETALATAGVDVQPAAAPANKKS